MTRGIFLHGAFHYFRLNDRKTDDWGRQARVVVVCSGADHPLLFLIICDRNY